MVIDMGVVPGGPGRGLAGGTCYLLPSPRSDPAYPMVEALMAEGRPALVVGRRHPDRLREVRPALARARILWLAYSPGEDHVSPVALQNLTHTIGRFFEENPTGVVLLDGLEALVTNNKWEQVLSALEAIRELVVTRQAILVVPVHPAALGAREMALLERTLEVYEPAATSAKPLDPETISHLLDHY